MEYIVLQPDYYNDLNQIDTVFGYLNASVTEIKNDLINHDGYDYNIVVVNVDKCKLLADINLNIIIENKQLKQLAIDAGYINEHTLNVINY